MKQKIIVAISVLLLLGLDSSAQLGYIYIHNKSINEANSTNYTAHITGGTTTVPDFILNDKPDYIHVGDVGAGNGTGRGELWAISNGTSTIGTSATAITGTVYHRSASSSQWSAITTTGSASAVDGAGLNACVYVSGNNVYYYKNGTTTQIFFSTGSLGNATDVTYANGITAIISSNGSLYYYNGAYGNNTSSNTNWNLFNAGTGNAGARIDLNWTGTTLVYITASATSIKTIPVNTTTAATTRNIAVDASLTYVNGSTGSTISGAATNDIAYDSAGVIYTIANVQYTPEAGGSGTTGIVFRYQTGDTYWTEEGEGRGIVRLTAGAGGMAWGTCSVGFADAIWTRASDNIGSHVWLDDERVRTTITNGNSIMIPVVAGTYTFTEDLPSSSYDLGRFNIYDPTGNSTGTPISNSASINVSAGETVNIEVFNEYLVPKSIDLTCATQILQTFGSGTTTSTSEYGGAVEGTAYHYANTTSPQDGYYMVVHQLVPGSNWFTYTNSYTVSDHTGNTNGYFFVVNASYARDEFYRQRVTNLVPGLQYTISFYLANILYTNPIKPNVNYGLQDLSGNIIDSASTGNLSTTGTWTYESFTFTATTSTADLYLRNNNIGGLGNDLALDDISLNPVLTKIGANEITPTIKPNLCIGTSYTFSNSVTGGTWLSSNSSVASINPVSGVAVTHTAGSVIITYKYINAVGCESDTTRGLSVTAPPTIVTSDLLGKTSCLNQPDSLYATASGTAAPFTYAWTATPTGNGLTNTTVQNTSALPAASGTYIYTVTATDTVGCAVSADDTLIVSTHSAPTVTLSKSGADCVGGTGGFTLTSSQSGGTGSYSWTWTGSPTGSGIVNTNATATTASPTAAGTYTYTVKVSDGFCTVPVSTTATAYASPSVSVSPASGSNVTVCSGGTVGLAALASSGTSPYTYYWSGSGSGNGMATSPNPTTANTTATPTSSGTDTYSVLLTDANGCTANGSTTLNITVSALAAPSITITSPSSATGACTGVGSVNLRATVGGGGINTYLWSGPGTITNPTSITTASVVPTSTGFYTLTVTNTLVLTSCTVSANSPVVTAYARPTVSAVTYATSVCTNTKDTLYATATGGTGSYTYLWTVSPTSGSTIVSSTSAATPVTFSTFDQTYSYTIQVTDGNNCKRSGSITIAALNQSGPSITGMASAATLCTNNTVSFSPTVTQGTSSTSITGTTFSSSHSSSSHADTYIIDNNTSTYWQSNTTNNEYVGIDFGSSYTINAVSVTPRNSTSGRSSLNGAKIQISTNGTTYTTLYTYPGNAPSGTSTYSVSGTGRYLRILFTNGTTGYLAELSAAYVANTPISSYTWTASPSAGSGLNSTTTQNTTATPTTAGAYKYYITAVDNVGCAATDSTDTQTVNATPTLSPLSADPAFCGTTGSIQLFANPSGGSGTYSAFTWSYTRTTGTGTISFDNSSQQNPEATVSGTSTNSAFTFTANVTDANTCTASGTTSAIVVTSFPGVTATSALAATACVGQNINLTGKVVSTTTAPYTYVWSPSSNSTVTPSSTTTSATTITASASTTTSGNYNYGLSVLDNNNCLGTATTSVIAINDTPKVAVALGTIPSPLCANPTSAINLTGSITTATTAPYTYAWSGSGITNVNATTTTARPIVTGGFGFTVTDANSCKGTGYSSSVTVDQATPSVTIVSCGLNSDGLNYHQLYESNGVNWLWTNVSGGGRFYTSSALSAVNDAESSTLQAPFIKLTGVYQVQITDPQGCIGTGQFTDTGHLSACNSVLVVSNLNLTVKKQNSNVLLNWVTTTEINNDHFDVQRSSDGVNWLVIATVKGFGNSTDVHNYSYTDNTPINGLNYYRLKQVDVDGHFIFSAIRTVQFTQQWLVHMYPNPASDFVILEFNNDKEEKAFITIQTASGSTVFTKEQTLARGYNRIKLNQVQPLAQGTYILTMATTANLYHSKFVKGEK